MCNRDPLLLFDEKVPSYWKERKAKCCDKQCRIVRVTSNSVLKRICRSYYFIMNSLFLLLNLTGL